MTDPNTLYNIFTAKMNAALDVLEAAGTLPADMPRGNISVEPPRDSAHGDLATNAAMVLAKGAGTNPRALAEALAAAHRGPAIGIAQFGDGRDFAAPCLRVDPQIDEARPRDIERDHVGIAF